MCCRPGRSPCDGSWLPPARPALPGCTGGDSGCREATYASVAGAHDRTVVPACSGTARMADARRLLAWLWRRVRRILRRVTDYRRTTAFSFRRQRLDGSAPSRARGRSAAVRRCVQRRTRPARCRSAFAHRPPRETRCSPATRTARRADARRCGRLPSSCPAATAALVRAATAVPIERFSWMLRAAHVAPEAFEDARRAAARRGRAAPHRPGAAVPPWTSTASRSGRCCRCSSLQGDLVSVGSGSMTSNASRYLSRVAWLGGEVEPDDPDPARRGRGWRGVSPRVRPGPGRRLRLVVRAERPPGERGRRGPRDRATWARGLLLRGGGRGARSRRRTRLADRGDPRAEVGRLDDGLPARRPIAVPRSRGPRPGLRW